MKKLFSVLFAVTLVFSSMVLPTAAANLPIVPADAKATITIEKSTGQQNGEGVLKADKQEVSITVGQYSKHVSDVYVYLEDPSTGNRKSLNYNDLTYASDNPAIFTVEDNYLHGVKLGSSYLTISYGDQIIKVKVNVVGAELILKFDNTHQANYVNFYQLRYLSYGNRYSSMSVSSKFNGQTGELEISGIDWSQKGPYYALVTLGNHIYKIEINEADRNQVITIPYNASDFTKVAFELPQNSAINSIQVAALKDNQAIANTNSYSNRQELYIANGEYAFILNGGNGHSVYKGLEKSANLTGGEQKISIPESQFSKSFVTLDFKNQGALLKSLNYCDYSVINSCGNSNAEGKEFYFTSGHYSSGTAAVQVSDYTYEFDLGQATFPSTNQIVLDDQLEAKLKFADKVYQGGTSFYLDNQEGSEQYLIIKNKNGLPLSQIRDDQYNYSNGKLILRNGSEVYEIKLENSLSYARVKLPNVSGTFEVTFTLGEGDAVPTKVRPDVSGLWKDWPNTKSVASDYTWTINLSDVANAATVTANNIFVVDAEGYLVEGVQVKTTGKQVFVSAPASGYEAGNYTLYVRDAVKNADGKALAKTKMAFEVK